MVWRNEDGLKGLVGGPIGPVVNFTGMFVIFFAFIYLLVFFTGAFTGKAVGVSWWQALVAGVVLMSTVRLLIAVRKRSREDHAE